MNGETFTGSPIPAAEGMAQRATVAPVRGDRGQADWRRRDQPGSPRGRSHPKNDPQRNKRTGGRSALSARRADTQAGWWQEKAHSQGRTAASPFGRDAGTERRSRELGQMDEQGSRAS